MWNQPQSCKTCEVLQRELEYAKRQNEILLGRLLNPVQPAPVEHIKEDLKPIAPSSKFMPWSVRQAILEKEDRAKAKILAERKADIDSLEEELKLAESV